MDKFDEETVKLPFGKKDLDAVLCFPTSVRTDVHTAVILTHGAGGDMNFRHLDYLKTLQKFTIKHAFFGGRSMGCRAAAALARRLSDESEDGVQGVICLSFPLHPPGQMHAHRQRSEDLRMLPECVRVLFVSGTEDNMCDRDLFDGVLKDMKAEAEVFWLQGGSHGLTVKGRSEESVMDEVNLKVISWIKKEV
ncbi:testis-expressed sequence 30 protein isoform X2 [Austrofundulus limnaeus]|uniref:Testis-expressed sequence 30 protein isoform X2 n=1 Tax=Austrofundulus limnaeus TaxID=52670 RepID=A0A2I4D4X0_AUSLI|nr:PREDICTED: testis-expressed sequence 30 protein isoform X2 [Austrofundulus limnaeus]